jgi:hypothetical protein
MLWTLMLTAVLAADPDPVAASELPAKAQALREAGVKPAEVKAALAAVREADLPADEAGDVLDESTDAVRKNGNVDNFGQFVKSKVEEGLRGKELAEAIHAEHAERGMGKGRGKGPPDGKGPDGEKGPPEGRGPDGEKGPPDGKGPPEDKGAGGDRTRGDKAGGGGGKGKGKGKGGGQ